MSQRRMTDVRIADAASGFRRSPMPPILCSDVLRTVRLTGAMFFEVAASAPWAAEQPPREVVLPKVLPGGPTPDPVSRGHRGTLLRGMHRRGADSARSRRGHRLHPRRSARHVERARHARRAGNPGRRSMPRRRPLPFFANYGEAGRRRQAGLRLSRLRCTSVQSAARQPAADHQGRAARGGDTSWLGQFIRLAVAESANKRAGGESVLAKLSELMFIEVVRRHLEALPPEQVRLARRPARSVRRQGAVADACAAGA